MLARPTLKPNRSGLALRSVALAVGTCVFVTSSPALAAPPVAGDDAAAEDPGIDTEARAMKAYREGQDAYDAGEYSMALELFLEAQSLYPSPDFHFNVARCHEALESYDQAVVSYKAYLRSYESAYGEAAPDKANTENKIDRLEKQIEADKAAAAATADKEPEVIIKTVEADKKSPGRGLIITGGVMAGVGVGVAVAGAAVFGTRAAGISSQLDEVYSGNPERVTLEEARQLDADGRAAQLNQIVMISIGSAVAVTGIALLSVGLVKRKKAPVVAPAIGPDSAGLVIRGRF
jgi:tetratricopeptide (TPR) repeat protein